MIWTYFPNESHRICQTHLFLPSCWSVASNTSEYTPEPSRIPSVYRSPGSCSDENVKLAGKEPVSTMAPDKRLSVSVVRLKMPNTGVGRHAMPLRNIQWQHNISVNYAIFYPGVFWGIWLFGSCILLSEQWTMIWAFLFSYVPLKFA